MIEELAQVTDLSRDIARRVTFLAQFSDEKFDVCDRRKTQRFRVPERIAAKSLQNPLLIALACTLTSNEEISYKSLNLFIGVVHDGKHLLFMFS
jgi:hypothetical protein